MKMQYITAALIMVSLTLTTFSTMATEVMTSAQQLSGRGYEGSLTIETTLYVNPAHANANDANAGTSADRPLRTIARANSIALNNKHNNIGTRILIAPGVYREFLYYSGAAGDAAIIYEAQQPDTVTLVGSELWASEWTQDGANWQHEWPFDWGAGTNPWVSHGVTMEEITRRRELVYVNGQRMTQVLSLDALADDTFYVDQDTNRLYLRLQNGVNPNGASVEVATRSAVFDVRSANNIVIRGITFRYTANNILGAAVMFTDSTNILIEDSSFHDNSWSGLDFRNVQHVTVRRSAANHNGIRGMGIHTGKFILFEDTENSYNNWRGAQGNFYNWDSGQKFLFVHDALFLRYRAVSNMAFGLWLDYNNENFIVEQAFLSDNYLAGLFIEAATGPLIVRDSTICDNRMDATDDSYYNAGVFLTGSDNVTLENNTICNNQGAQIRILGPFNRSGTDWEDGTSFTTQSENLHVIGNTITANSSGDLLISTTSHPSLMTSVFQNNSFYNPFNPNAFRIDADMTLQAFEAQVKTASGNSFGQPDAGLPQLGASSDGGI